MWWAFFPHLTVTSIPFQAHIDGYARLFGIFEELRMLATRDVFQIYLTTDTDKSFKISVQITTNYSSGRNHTQLSANVIFENGLSKVIRTISVRLVQGTLPSEMLKLKMPVLYFFASSVDARGFKTSGDLVGTRNVTNQVSERSSTTPEKGMCENHQTGLLYLQ